MKLKKAFTLIEILIAVAIFSTAMIISSGIFSNIIGNQSLVTVSSSVNLESQRIIRQISDDTVNATSTGTTSYNKCAPKGILFLKDNSIASPTALPIDCVATASSVSGFNGIVLFSPTGIKIYRFNSANKTIEYGINTSDPKSQNLLFDTSVPPKISSVYKFSTLGNSDVEIVSSSFSGIYCYNSSCSQVPYVKIDMTTETAGYATKAARHRAKLELRTMITGRSY